jgi:hypothetical protein
VDAAAPARFSFTGIDNLMRSGSDGNRLRLSRRGVTVRHSNIHSSSDLAARRDFDWKIETPVADSLDEIAQHAENNADWLERSLV